MSKVKDLQEVYKVISEKMDRTDVKRISAKSDTDITNVDTKEFVRTLGNNVAELKRILIKAATLNEKTPELEMFVVAYNNLVKVLEDKKKIQTEE